MATAAERQQRIVQIREFPAKVEAAIAGLNEKQLSTPGGGEDWSVRQIVHHLADAHMNALVRVKLILTEDKPILKPFNQEDWAKLRDTTELPLEPSLRILHGLHQRWAALLESLPESAWDRTGVHLERGIVTLDQQIQTYANHGEDHLRQIERVKAAVRS